MEEKITILGYYLLGHLLTSLGFTQLLILVLALRLSVVTCCTNKYEIEQDKEKEDLCYTLPSFTIAQAVKIRTKYFLPQVSKMFWAVLTKLLELFCLMLFKHCKLDFFAEQLTMLQAESLCWAFLKIL